MICIRTRSSSKFDKIRPPTAELAALECLKNPHRLIMGKQCCHFFSAIVDQILFIFAGKDEIHKSLDKFEIQQDQIIDHRVSSS